MIPLVLAPARWARIPDAACALRLFHEEFAQPAALLPADFGAQIPSLLARVPAPLQDSWLTFSAKEWLWQTAVCGRTLPLPPASPLLPVRLFGAANPPLNAFVGRRAAVAVIPLAAEEGRTRTLRLWAFEKSGDLCSDHQHLLRGIDSLRLQPGDRIYCDRLPDQLDEEGWQLGAALAFAALRETDRRHAEALGREWIVAGSLNAAAQVLPARGHGLIELLRDQPWTGHRRWILPHGNRRDLLELLTPIRPVHFVETLSGAHARLFTGHENLHQEDEICALLLARGFRLAGSAEAVLRDRALDTLSLLLAFDYSVYAGLLQAMRLATHAEGADFRHVLGHRSRAETLGHMCYLLRQNGILEHYSLDASQVRGRIVRAPAALHFLRGDWLERCVRVFLENFLNIHPARVGCLQNLCGVRPDGGTFELDTLIKIDQDLFWIESKSGDFDVTHLERYALLREMMGLPKSHVFLVAGEPERAGDSTLLGPRHGITFLKPSALPELMEELEQAYLTTASPRAQTPGR